MQGARNLRNEAYIQYAAVTKVAPQGHFLAALTAKGTQQMKSFYDAIMIQ